MKNQLQMTKKVFKWIMACWGRGLIVLIPLGYVTMLLLDVTVFAHYHYKDVTEIVWLECLGGLFYLVCLRSPQVRQHYKVTSMPPSAVALR